MRRSACRHRVPVSRRSWRRRERPGFTSHTVYPPQREYPSRHRAKTTLWEQSPWLIFRSSLWRWGNSIDGDERNSKVDRGHDYWPSQDQERTSLDCARRAVDPAPSVESLRRLLCRPRTPAQFVPWRPLDPAELREKQGASMPSGGSGLCRITTRAVRKRKATGQFVFPRNGVSGLLRLGTTQQ
jgi:hypothetical protein